MKHVLVIDQLNTTTQFLQGQDIRNREFIPSVDHSLKDSLDRLFERSAKQAVFTKGAFKGTRSLMRSNDNEIQYYRFKDKFPATGVTQFKGPEHLEYWIWELRDKLRMLGEPLDALVIPMPDGQLKYDRMKHVLEMVKDFWPDIHVMVVAPTPEAGYGEEIHHRDPFNSNVLDHQLEQKPSPLVDEVVSHVRRVNANKGLSYETAERLRAKLEIPLLSEAKQQGKGRG